MAMIFNFLNWNRKRTRVIENGNLIIRPTFINYSKRNLILISQLIIFWSGILSYWELEIYKMVRLSGYPQYSILYNKVKNLAVFRIWIRLDPNHLAGCGSGSTSGNVDLDPGTGYFRKMYRSLQVAAKVVSSVNLSIEFTQKIILCFNYITNITICKYIL